MSETLIRMPRLADTLVEGTVSRWLKQVGDRIAAGEPLASIETDKVTTELSSPVAGALLEVLVGEGQTVTVDTPIARVGEGGDAPPVPRPTSEATATQLESAPTTEPPPTEFEPAQTLRVTPVAARLLAEHGLAPDAVGASGRVTKSDVLRYLDAQRPASPPAETPAPPAGPATAPLSSMRRAIAEH
ncbi:MAG: E3 binding domain-containing protein, partial [Chloroflexota bacterium]|nr:E3 binding domain-containing protein [Chloroflexota bacterium]